MSEALAIDVARLKESEDEWRQRLAEVEAVIDNELRPAMVRLETEFIAVGQRLVKSERVLLEVQGEFRQAIRAVQETLDTDNRRLQRSLDAIMQHLGVQQKVTL